MSIPLRFTRGDEDLVIADFEGASYGKWVATGEAFGSGPAQGTLPAQMAVTGYMGHGLANSYSKGDSSQGTLTSPPVKIERKFINFLVGGGNHPNETCMNLLLDGAVVRSETGRDSEHLDWATWDVSDLRDKTVQFEIVDRNTGGWGHICIDQIMQSDERKASPVVVAPLYAETYRPQFHFTAQHGWLNDPNGMVFSQGEYHLFFQHNPKGTQWGNMTWGHAVSPDMVHWRQLANAIEPDKLGTIFSGSAVVDWHNRAGFQKGDEPPLVAMYTAAGNPFTQCIAFSNDKGRSFVKYEKNPVLPHLIGENRDPRLIWYEPTKSWILALFKDGDVYALFSSSDLKEWKHLQDLPMPGCGECPDFFPIAVDGDPSIVKWVLTAANGKYFIGSFDGSKFTPEGGGPFQVEFGRNCYAVQTYSDIPQSDGRRIQIGWMNGGSYPQMPFNQQMSFPCRLTLHKSSDGLRLWKYPVGEIESIRGPVHEYRDLAEAAQADPLAALSGDLFDIDLEFQPGEAQRIGLKIRGQEIVYDVKAAHLSALGDASLAPVDGKVKLRILVDRTSIETYGNDGQIALSSCYLAPATAKPLEWMAVGRPKQVSLKVYELKSAWPQPSDTGAATIP